MFTICLRHGHVAGDALRADRQLQVAAGVQAGLDLGDDGAAVVVHRVQRQAVGVEQLADVLARLEHDLVDVLGGVDAGRDLLQLAEEQRLEGDAALVRRQLLRAEEFLLAVTFHHCTHSSNSCPARSQRMSCTTLGPNGCVWSNAGSPP
jgi:hypothetical protein